MKEKSNRSRRTFALIIVVLGLLLFLVAGVAGAYALRTVSSNLTMWLTQLSGVEQAAAAESLFQGEDPALLSERGVLINSVDASGPAAQAGVRRGTIILSVDGQVVNTPQELVAALEQVGAGNSVSLRILNGSAAEDVSITLADAPPLLGVMPVNADCACGTGDFTLPEGLKIAPDTFRFEDLTFLQGITVVEVTPESPAAAAGLQVEDVIDAVNGQEVRSVDALIDLIAAQQPGDSVVLTVLRGDETVEVVATLGTHPEDAERPYLGVALAASPHLEGRPLPKGEGNAPEGFFFQMPPDGNLDQFFEEGQLPNLEEILPHLFEQMPEPPAPNDA